MKSRLIIVQHKPTQFDVPLFEYMERHTDLDLLVYYTATSKADWSVDTEIGLSPQWDNLKTGAYQRKDPGLCEIAGASGIATEIAMHRPDLVIICGYSPLLHAKLAGHLKRKGVRIGLRSDNTLRHGNFKGARGLMKRLILPYLLSLYDTWHPVGTLAAQYLRKIAATERPVFLFPYNVDNKWFEQESSNHIRHTAAIRSAMGFSSDDFVVLGVLKWTGREDPLTLLSAFALLRERQANARLILVGDGPLSDKIHAMAEKLGTAVYMPGYVPYSELPKYYAVSDVFVHPAPGEPWGVSVNEAMACGVPVIAAEGVGAGADLIVEGTTGFVFPDRDSRGLCEKLLLLAKDEELLKGMRTAAKQKVSEWSYEQTCSEFLRAVK